MADPSGGALAAIARIVWSIISHPTPQKWKLPAMILGVPVQSGGGLPNPVTLLEKTEGGRIKVRFTLALRIESDEHERRLAIRASEIHLWRWHRPFRIVKIPVERYAERGKGQSSNEPPIIEPLDTFDGWLRYCGEFPQRGTFCTDWHAWLVIHFRGFRSFRKRLVMDWERPLRLWNELIEYGLSQMKGAEGENGTSD